MRYAIDVDLIEIVERRPNSKNCEAELEQNEEEHRDYNDRNECEDNFLNVGHET